MNTPSNPPTGAQTTSGGVAASEIDQLIPPARSAGTKLVIGVLIVGAALVLSLGYASGFFVPRPLANTSASYNDDWSLNTSTGLVQARVALPNNSMRDVRVTAASLDARGATLVKAEVVIETTPAVEYESDADGNPLSGTLPDPVETRSALPAPLESGADGYLDIWFEVDECIELTDDWGFVDVTVDFGEGAFPSMSRTIRIQPDPLYSAGHSGNGLFVDGEMTRADQPLQFICEVLG